MGLVIVGVAIARCKNPVRKSGQKIQLENSVRLKIQSENLVKKSSQKIQFKNLVRSKIQLENSVRTQRPVFSRPKGLGVSHF
jgi:hypothetical protein